MKKIVLLLLPLFIASLSSCENNTPNNQTKIDDSQEQEEQHEEQHEDGEDEEEEPQITEWKYTLDFSTCNFEDGNSFSETTLQITDTISFNFLVKGSGDKKTKYYEPSVRFYAGNKFSIVSLNYDIKKINFTFESGEKSNDILVNVGTFTNSTWQGLSKNIEFTIDGQSGHRRISKIEACFDKEGIQPKDEIRPDPVTLNLGEKSISEVKEYITQHPVKKNSFGNGVDNKTLVTIKGFALAKIDLAKTTKTFGLDVSECAKVILADSTGAIGLATKITKDGTSLWGKIGDYICKETSKYIVTGFISEYLGHPELLITSFSWDKDLNISWSPEVLSEGNKTIQEFYNEANNTIYNCAGHGYGKIITLNNLTCYNVESDGSGKRYIYFTDGVKSLRVNAFNIGTCSEGRVYNVTGIISIKNYSPIIVAFKISTTQEEKSTIDYENVATSITISELKNIHASQDDTSNKYPEVINAYGTFYKTTGYLTAVEEGGKLYVGLSPTYKDKIITGKDNAKANYDILLIKNENFWNTTEEELYLFNSYYDDYLLEDEEITLYYVPRQLTYQNNTSMWEIFLIPESIPAIQK